MSTPTRDLGDTRTVSGSRRRRRPRPGRGEERTLLSPLDRRDPFVRTLLVAFVGVVLASLVIACAGPVLWLFKAATSSSTETLADPFSWWPSGVHWENFTTVLTEVDLGRYFLNTVWVMTGSLLCGLLVATTGGYWLAVLRPRGAGLVSALVLATLFIPGVVSLVALYLTVVDVPLLGVSLVDTFWAVWLPAGANAVNVLLVQRYLATLPREVFEAATLDGAGPIRVFFSLVLPMSRPMLGVVSLLIVVGAYKDYLWPLLVLVSPDVQPLSVVLPRLERSTGYAPFMAALFLSAVVPILVFLAFQRQFLRAAGNAGALRG